MCGILFYNRNNVGNNVGNNVSNNVGNNVGKTISEIFSVIKYRGPDSTNINFVDNLLFCHHRLAIINSTGGEQPIIREFENGGKIVLIANGEIYNYKKFTKSQNDCEAIIDCYQNNCLQELDGDFAFVLYDKQNQLIVTGRDPVGLKPLYIGFSQMGKAIAFTSEIKVLTAIESVKEVREHQINTFNRFYIDQSGVINFHDSLSVINYNIPIVPQTYEFAQQAIRHYLVNAIKKRITHTERPFAFLCSGGIDSVIVVAIAVQLGIPLHVFTISMESDNSNSYDEIYADMFMKEIMKKRENIQYTKVKFSIQEGLEIIEDVIKKLETYDPNSIRAAIPMYLLAKYIKNNSDYKVILSGEGSDELFMGYNYFGIKNPTAEQAEKESIRLVQNLHSFDLLRGERCFSCHGLELRVPFLDRDLINNILQIPGQYRLPIGGIEKQLLRQSFVDLGINDKILFRQKERMSDGVGGSWVPALINYCVSQSGLNTNLNTNDRLICEKDYYLSIYKKYYQFAMILPRELPQWAEQEQTGNLLAV